MTIETALAAWRLWRVPTVAAYSAANLETWVWPREVRRVVIFADNDISGRGQLAATRLHERVRAAGLHCEVQTPQVPDTDWADIWAAAEAAHVDRIQDQILETFEPAAWEQEE